VCKNTLIIKDHFCETAFDRTLLGFMDKIGNSRHGIASTGNYLSEKEWKVLFKKLGLRIIELKRGLKIHPAVIRWLFHSRLHFIAVLSVNNHENK
ncbi:MAG: SAM-dependent methyltransferase, partial [Candidatus Omnitrophota bacterium]|nr:SAM-dependent methyltransferase [Candidatus Omnitrophota bacterium]